MKTQKQFNEPDWEFLYYALELEQEWKKSLPKLSDKELLAIFPEAKEIIPEKVMELEEDHKCIENEIREKLTVVKKQSKQKNQSFWKAWIKATDIKNLLVVENHISRLKRLLFVSKGRVQKGRISEAQIQQARLVPIENIINQKLRKCGKAFVGLCPLHNERTPSFYVYPESNSFYCFGCNQGGDSIALLRTSQGYSFAEAVRYLVG